MSWEELRMLLQPDSGTQDKVYGVHWNALMHHGIVKEPAYIVYSYVKDSTTYYAAVNGQTGKIDYGGENNAGGVSGTSASAVINACVNALTNGGKIFVKAGTYIIDSPILIQGKNNIVLEGEGWRCTKLVTSGADTICIKIGDRTNAALASTDIVVRGFFIDGSSQTTDTTPPEDVERRLGIEVCSPSGQTRRYVIEECYVYNTGSDGVYMLRSPHGIIRNNIVEGVRAVWAGIHGHLEGQYARIEGNYIFNCNCSGIRHGAVIANNQLYDNGLSGATDGREAQVVGSSYGVIVGNYIEHYSRARVGIRTWVNNNIIIGNFVMGGITTSTTTPYSRHLIIGNFICRTVVSGAIRLEKITGAVVAYNTIDEINTAHGIHLLGCQRCVVKGNVLKDVGYGANNNYDGIRLEASGSDYCLRNVIAGNQVFSGQTNKPRYGIVEADSNQDYNIIANNIVTDCATTAILKQGVNSILDNNITG